MGEVTACLAGSSLESDPPWRFEVREVETRTYTYNEEIKTPPWHALEHWRSRTASTDPAQSVHLAGLIARAS